MEEIYLKKRFTEHCVHDKIVDFNSFVDSFTTSVKDLYATDLCQLVGVSDRRALGALETACKPPILTSRHEGVVYSDGVKRNFEYYDLPNGLSRLKSVEYLKSRTKTQAGDMIKELHYPREVNLRLMNRLKAEEIEAKKRQNVRGPLKLTPHDEFLLTARVYSADGDPEVVSQRSPVKVTHEFLCLSSNTLRCLKESIQCPKDFQPAVYDVSLNPTFPAQTLRAKDTITSSYFYFHEGFYVSEPRPGESDLSFYARNWFDRMKWPYEVGNMDEVKFKDVKIRLGYPYVYAHQSHCEHLIVFTDVRILSFSDDLNPTAYPILNSFSGPRCRVCHLCEYRTAKFIVDDCERLPRKYALTCTTCLLRYCYKDNTKIGEFKVYKYVDRVAII